MTPWVGEGSTVVPWRKTTSGTPSEAPDMSGYSTQMRIPASVVKLSIAVAPCSRSRSIASSNMSPIAETRAAPVSGVLRASR